MKKGILVLVVLTTMGLIAWRVVAARKTAQVYAFVELHRGSLENVVSGTGTLSAVGTVEIGIQVSGTLAKVYVDYNDRVSRGQVLAELDANLFEASVRDARANVTRTRARLEQAEAELKRNQKLFEKGLLAANEFTNVQTNRDVAKADYESAQASQDRAETNLGNAKVCSPIDGTVIERNVEVGQTVAASLQAPKLFLIAEDLSHMEIKGLVDESDIGQVRVGQNVRFTVQAYPNETFSGAVRQIRLQPQTIQNVVNYTVVVDATNDRGLLLPGMTATMEFIVERVEDVLTVPAAALRFRPSEEDLAGFQERQRKQTEEMPESVRPSLPRRGRDGGAPTGVGPAGIAADVGRLWYLDADGRLAMVRVQTGATDGL